MAHTVMVTGADGFIGSHLTEELVKRGEKVRAFCLYNSFGSLGWIDTLPPEIRSEIDIFMGDVRDPNGVRTAMRGQERVFHLAALIAIPFSYHSPDSYVDTNIKGTLNVLNAARELDTQRVLVTSTSEVYGTAQYVPIDEKHPFQGQSPYSATKIGADRLAESFYRSFDLPEGEGNEEMRDAVLQNSLREYDFYDPATNTIEKVFDEPYYPEDRNELKSYLGYCGDKLYFVVSCTDGASALSRKNTLVSYDRTAGTWQEECSADAQNGEDSGFWPFLQDGRLKLVVLWRGKDTLTLYSIDNGARYEVPYEEAGSDATGNRNFPIALTDDGRILVTDGYIDRNGVAASRYALIDLDAYLAGSREYTAVEMWTE